MSQHDMDVANQGFSAFRADMNLALVALATLSSGASAPSTTFAYQLWADTTSGLLKQRNAANSGWVVRGTLAEAFVTSRSSNTILAGGDLGKTIICTAGFTQTLTAAATLGDGWYVDLNAQGFSVIIDPNGAETIDGAATKTVTGSGRIYCNGSAFFTIGFATSSASGGGFYAPTASVGSSALTVTVPSGTVLNFNDGTSVTLGSSISVTVSSGSTLGTVNGQYSNIWIAAIKNGGTPELAVRNNWNDSARSLLGFDMGNTITTTAEGGAGAADSAQVWYSTTARSAQPWCPVGYVVSSQATAGTWATSPLITKGIGPGSSMPGAVLQEDVDTDATNTTLATSIPRDDTIPQNTEGTQVFSTSLTPISPANLLESVATIHGSTNGGPSAVIVATFIDSGANAVQAVEGPGQSTTVGTVVTAIYKRIFNTTSAMAAKIRVGGPSATTAYLNGNASGRLFGGVATCMHQVREIQT